MSKLPYFQVYAGDYISSRLFYESLELNGFYLKVKSVMSKNDEKFGFLCEDSKALSLDRVAMRIPGASPELCLSLLEKLVHLGTLQKTPEGMYFDPALLEQEERRISATKRKQKSRNYRRRGVTQLSRVTALEYEYDNETAAGSKSVVAVVKGLKLYEKDVVFREKIESMWGEWGKAYPGVDLLVILKKMHLHELGGNPYKNRAQAFNNWLANEVKWAGERKAAEPKPIERGFLPKIVPPSEAKN